MSYVFDTYLHDEFLEFEDCCVSDPAIDLLKLESFQGKLLDFACGHAPYLPILQGYSELTLLDKSAHLLEKARDTAEKLGRDNVRYFNAHSENMPFEDNTFDAVMSSFALGDVTSWRQTMAEMERVIKPDGIFILIDLVGGNNDFIYDMVQIADVIEGVQIGRESSEIWCFLINYLNHRAKLLKYETFRLTYEFPNRETARKLAEGLEIRMKKSQKVKEAIHAYLDKKDSSYEIDSVYLKMKILKR
jgi:ubiquinone/menaquinone biosynthesis C-methylase UbiE